MKLRHLLFATFLLLSGCGAPEGPPRQERPPVPPPVNGPLDPGVFRGEVVALGCYLRQGARGESHRTCAEACLKQGMPVGLLESGGKVLLLLPQAPGQGPDFSAFAAQRCEVRGVLLNRAGMYAVEVASITRLPEPQPPGKVLPPPAASPTISP